MRTELITPPDLEPITLEEAKLFARVDTAADDAIITALITTARQYTERYLQQSLLQQTWLMWLDAAEYEGSNRYRLRYSPIESVTEVKLYSDSDSVIIEPSSYRLSGDELILVAARSGNIRLHDALSIEYVAGYGDSSDKVPEVIRHAMLMLIAHWYEYREASGDVVIGTQSREIPFGVTAILSGYRNYYA